MLFCKATESVYNNTNLGGILDFSAAAIKVLVLVAQFTESGAFFLSNHIIIIAILFSSLKTFLYLKLCFQG